MAYYPLVTVKGSESLLAHSDFTADLQHRRPYARFNVKVNCSSVNRLALVGTPPPRGGSIARLSLITADRFIEGTSEVRTPRTA